MLPDQVLKHSTYLFEMNAILSAARRFAPNRHFAVNNGATEPSSDGGVAYIFQQAEMHDRP